MRKESKKKENDRSNEKGVKREIGLTETKQQDKDHKKQREMETGTKKEKEK